MLGVAKGYVRSRWKAVRLGAFGMHQADAGSDAYDRDFALSLLSKEQDGLYEIEEALKRIDLGTYGICEISNKPIAHARLEAIPFARYTVECQSQIEKQNKHFNIRKPVTSLFGLTEKNPAKAKRKSPPRKRTSNNMPRDFIILECTEAKAEGKPVSRYISTRNKKSLNTPNRLEKKKYNPHLKRHTLHRETR
jgi:ribosomal protein L33